LGGKDGSMRESMEIYPKTAAERAMKLQEVLLRASSGKIKWWQAAELMGISPRQLRRWRKRLEEQGYKGLLDRRCGTPSRRRVPKAQAEEVLSLYRDKYFDLNVRHFHEKLVEEHQIGLSYTWVKQALQAAGLVKLPHCIYFCNSGWSDRPNDSLSRRQRRGDAMSQPGLNLKPNCGGGGHTCIRLIFAQGRTIQSTSLCTLNCAIVS
jgi:transposase